MSSTLLISEVSARSGFTPSTLRYYEQVGLLAAADRTPAGYRVYGEADIARLRFIDRAKKLGLPLEEIRELVAAWDGGTCSHLQQRLRAHTVAKAALVRSRIAELTTFAARLERAGDELSVGPGDADVDGDGPCTDGCGCADAAFDEAPQQPPVEPGTAGRPPVVCTLPAADRPDRLAEWTDVLSQARERTEIEAGLTFGFESDPVLAGRLAALAAREKACCSFFVFTLHVRDEGLRLDVHAPADALGILSSAFDSAG